MNRLFNRNRMLMILFGIIILIILIGFSITDRSTTTKAEQFTADAAAGSQMIIEAPLNFAGSIFSSIRQSFNAVEENEQLRAQLEMLPQMQSDLERLKAENEELREALDISSKQSYESINARADYFVILNPDHSHDNSILLDKK